MEGGPRHLERTLDIVFLRAIAAHLSLRHTVFILHIESTTYHPRAAPSRLDILVDLHLLQTNTLLACVEVRQANRRVVEVAYEPTPLRETLGNAAPGDGASAHT